ncbi:PDZ and LIM domain 3-like isoform X2 [Brachionus plicatilis]|uniref:PDZ and LIM domain 3-like isoform X2 n=1 Tax=Brachionus plicatilis TaxID=10195 RepID=A0A3M7QFS1_BRAPC|nr:PDZ and LIM domain 3-like isoform X2 [Brachionus plicatilis]
MLEKVHIRRESKEIPFGFKIQGGSEFSIPLSVLQVTPGSVAERCGLRSGDAILEINGIQTTQMEHNQAKKEIMKCGDDFFLTVQRNAVDTVKPQHTPLSQLKSNPPVNLNNLAPPPPAVKTDLTANKTEMVNIGTSHNRAAMPFNKAVGNGIDYKSAKPSNWKPGDYTKWAPETPQQNESPTVTAVFHKQYNTPIGMYSDSNVFQEFQNQTKSILPEIANKNPVSQGPSTVSSFASQDYHPQPSSNPPIGTNSLSMKMLNHGINEAQTSNGQPPSIFDLKRGNPTGATVPRGFKSVQAPTVLPSEQRHAPMRVEYQAQHLKQNWIEPKLN